MDLASYGNSSRNDNGKCFSHPTNYKTSVACEISIVHSLIHDYWDLIL